ncbi:MarR family winged helix-turn-helix transcriptional regulator [Geoglobus acetivorans]|uniref:Transcriptional regulator, MarR family n=1 Tax=Geoglobus acetivorans TaxID=565033 RepID=A0A0A7GFI0_GEOAI|nr:Transcriptional regulator, MarR family [Geoglobus acetivorans]
MDLLKYIFLINRHVRKEVQRELGGKLNFLEFKVLLTVYRGVESQIDIVEETGLSKGTVSKALKKLEEGGFIVRKRSGRKYAVELTESGQSIMQEFENLTDVLGRKMLAGFREEEINALESFFRKMLENLEER